MTSSFQPGRDSILALSQAGFQAGREHKQRPQHVWLLKGPRAFGAMSDSDLLAAFLWKALPTAVLRSLGWSTTADIKEEILNPRTKHFAEFFCGSGGLVTALSQAGMRCAWFDIDLQSSHNILSVAGLSAAVRIALSVMPGGLVWFGVPCSTFVWLARGHTKRSRQHPLGDVTRGDVQRANHITKVVAMLCRLLSARSVFFFMEQLAGSVLLHVPSIRLTARRLQMRGERWSRRFVWLGHYGHLICKPTELCGIFPHLARVLPSRRPKGKSAAGVYRQWKSKSGRKRVCGSSGLKATEHYPKRFCCAVAREVARCIARSLG